MDELIRVLHPFNSISVTSRRSKGEHERLCEMKRCLGSGRISPPAGFKPGTPDLSREHLPLGQFTNILSAAALKAGQYIFLHLINWYLDYKHD